MDLPDDPTFEQIAAHYEAEEAQKAAAAQGAAPAPVAAQGAVDPIPTDAQGAEELAAGRPIDPVLAPQGGAENSAAAGRPNDAPQGDADSTVPDERHASQGDAGESAAGRPSTATDMPQGGVSDDDERPKKKKKGRKPPEDQPPKPPKPPTPEEIAAGEALLHGAIVKTRLQFQVELDDLRAAFTSVSVRNRDLQAATVKLTFLSAATAASTGPADYSTAFTAAHDLLGEPLPRSTAADLAAAFRGQADDADPALAELRAAEREVLETEEVMAKAKAAIDDYGASLSVEERRGESREAIIVDLDPALRTEMVAGLAALGQELPPAFGDPAVPMTDAMLADLRLALTSAQYAVSTTALDEVSEDIAAERRAVSIAASIRAAADRVMTGIEANVTALDELLLDNGWDPLGPGLREQADRILHAKTRLPEVLDLDLTTAEALPTTYLRDFKPRRRVMKTERLTVVGTEDQAWAAAVDEHKTAAAEPTTEITS